MATIKATQAHDKESLTVGWTAEDIAESYFNADKPILQKVAHAPQPNQSFKTLLDMQAAAKALLEVHAQKYHRQNIDAALEIMHRTIQDFLQVSGVAFFRKKPDVVFGEFFTYISIDGPHIFNQAARAIYNEYGLHIMISGRTQPRLMHGYLQIPPQFLAQPKGMQKVVGALTNLLANASHKPAVFFEASADRPHMQTAKGLWRPLDWSKLVDQIVRVKFRDPPPTPQIARFLSKPEILSTSESSLQHVHSLDHYLTQYPEPVRTRVAHSLSKRIKESSKPYVYLGIETADRWFELWPIDQQSANIESMSAFVESVVQSRQFVRAITGQPHIKFHVIIGDRNARPISAEDLHTFDILEDAINSALYQNRPKYPPTYIELVKVTLNQNNVIIFEPVIPNLESADQTP